VVQPHAFESLRIRDQDAVLVLQNVFLETSQVPVQLLVLERLQNLYAFFPENYQVIRELGTFSALVGRIAGYPLALQEQLLKTLEYTVVVLNIVPEPELLTLIQELQRPIPASLARSALAFFNKLLSHEHSFLDVFREIRLVDLLVDDLRQVHPHAPLPFGGNALT